MIMFSFLDFLYLSYSGRIGRMAYWLGTLGLMIIQLLAVLALLHLAHVSVEQLALLDRDAETLPADVASDLVLHVMVPLMIVSLLFLYPTYAIATKRWHDRGKSGWWSLIGFVPLIGGLWMLIELGFLGGDDGANDYGYR